MKLKILGLIVFLSTLAAIPLVLVALPIVIAKRQCDEILDMFLKEI